MSHRASPGRSHRRRATVAVAGVCGASLLLSTWGASSSAPAMAATAATKAKAGTKTTRAPKTTSPTAPATTAAPRRKLVVGTLSEPTGFDPTAASEGLPASGVIDAMYDNLIDAPIGKDPQPALAESFAESTDRLSWTLKIRSGVMFHDGTALNADGVKLNLDRHRKSRFTGQEMSVVKSVDVVDPMTVKLSLFKPYTALPYLLAGNIGLMVSPKAIQEKADLLNRAPTDAGTGPYILKEWVPGDHATLVRNPNYWGVIKPRLDQITFKLVIDEGARLAGLESGDLQSMLMVSPQLVNQAVKDGFTLVQTPTSGELVMYFNNAKPPFDDVRIRRAAALALDLKAVSVALGDTNSATQGYSIWPKDNPWYSAGGSSLAYDRAAARNLVNDYIKSTGRDAAFALTVVNSGGTSVDYYRLIAKYWNDAGMSAKVVEVPDFNQQVIALVTSQYEASGFGFFIANDPDATAYPLLASASPTNFSHYKSADMDAALEDGRTAADPAARKAAYARVQEIFRRDVPFIPGANGPTNILSAKDVCGLLTTGGFTAKTVGIGNC